MGRGAQVRAMIISGQTKGWDPNAMLDPAQIATNATISKPEPARNGDHVLANTPKSIQEAPEPHNQGPVPKHSSNPWSTGVPGL